ncbi:helix-turn-helix transcriptional regulator [Psychrobacter aquimaris]|mgnify:CR=1 FL=1|uniref:helix-turn-helix transcriptional regulator n=2 Tax=Moraxellaceae TaxID=468 RepID=UPI0018E03C2A|nr:AlpA family phage regulatory protein [Psychrobacter sp. M9-54-1]
MKTNEQFLRMSDLANCPEIKARTYTTQSGRQKTVTAKSAKRGIVGFSSKHIYKMIRQNRFPAPIKIDGASLWRLSDINKWIEKHSASSNDGER